MQNINTGNFTVKVRVFVTAMFPLLKKGSVVAVDKY